MARRRVARLRGRDDRARRRSSRCARAAATTIDTVDGRFAVRPLGPPLPLLALPPARARDVARGVLGRFAKDDVYERWLRTQENALLANAVCARDAVPAQGDVDLTAWVPFLGA